MDAPPLGASKNREFGYKWNEFWIRVAAIPIVFGLWWITGDLSPTDIPVVAILSLIAIGWAAFPLCRVSLTKTVVRIDYLFPFRKNLRFQHSDITGYDEMRLKILGNAVIGGFLEVAEEKNRFMIMKSQTQNFVDLNALLRERYPATKNTN